MIDKGKRSGATLHFISSSSTSSCFAHLFWSTSAWTSTDSLTSLLPSHQREEIQMIEGMLYLTCQIDKTLFISRCRLPVLSLPEMEVWHVIPCILMGSYAWERFRKGELQSKVCDFSLVGGWSPALANMSNPTLSKDPSWDDPYLPTAWISSSFQT